MLPILQSNSPIRRTDIPEGDGNVFFLNFLSKLRIQLEEPISPKGTETCKVFRRLIHLLKLEEPISPKGTETVHIA